MATAQTIINRSLRLLGQIPSGASPTAQESADALVAMNAMTSSWNNERLMCYAIREESMTISAVSATIGPSGDLDTTRPVSIEAAWIVDSNTSYYMNQISDQEYAAIPDKTATADWPDRFNYKPSMSTGTLYFYPVPDASRTLKLLTRTPLADLALTDTVALPPGWEDALASNLAIYLAPEYETQPSAAVIKMAVDSKASIKRVNAVPMKAYTELGALLSPRQSNIITGP